MISLIRALHSAKLTWHRGSSVIEYALLFGLGFLSSVLVVMLVAPAVHGRIVAFTERRLKATMPLSPQEIRAQKDMARAAYAAENARMASSRDQERARADALQLSNDELSREASRLHAHAQELLVEIDNLKVEAGELRSLLRRDDSHVTEMQEALKRAEESAAEKDLEIEGLMARLDKVAHELDNLKIERTTRMAENEDLKLRIQALRDERDELRREQGSATKRAREAEQRLTQEEHHRLRLDDRLVKEIAVNADKDVVIDRRTAEIARLKEKLKHANAELRRAASADRGRLDAPPLAAEFEADTETALDLAEIAADVRHQYAALAEQLNRAKSPSNDEALRDEIADLAAKMIVMTAASEGDQSPIPHLVAANEPKPRNGKRSLAERARARNPKLG